MDRLLAYPIRATSSIEDRPARNGGAPEWSRQARPLPHGRVATSATAWRGLPVWRAAILAACGYCNPAVQTTRKPASAFWPSGAADIRCAGRQLPAGWYQLPPLRTRLEPVAQESVCAELDGLMFTLPSNVVMLSAYQSRQHSHTLPCMSYSPHEFGS